MFSLICGFLWGCFCTLLLIDLFTALINIVWWIYLILFFVLLIYNMKYLQIHKIIWALLVLVYTLMQGLYVLLCCLLYTLWTFKLISFNRLWRDMQSVEYFTSTEDKITLTTKYPDDNIIDTLYRRYHLFDKRK